MKQLQRAHSVTVNVASQRVDGLHDTRVIGGYLVYPILMHVALPRPSILKCTSLRRDCQA